MPHPLDMLGGQQIYTCIFLGKPRTWGRMILRFYGQLVARKSHKPKTNKQRALSTSKLLYRQVSFVQIESSGKSMNIKVSNDGTDLCNGGGHALRRIVHAMRIQKSAMEPFFKNMPTYHASFEFRNGISAVSSCLRKHSNGQSGSVWPVQDNGNTDAATTRISPTSTIREKGQLITSYQGHNSAR